jgi:hypothetical protein
MPTSRRSSSRWLKLGRSDGAGRGGEVEARGALMLRSP